MSVLADIRPDDWNFPLLVHVLGAALLVGGLLTAAAALFLAWRRQRNADAAVFGRLAFRSLLFVAVPAWVIMRVGADWILSRENLDDLPEDPTWLELGGIIADAGAVLILVSLILAGLGARRLARSGGETSTLLRFSTVLVTVALVGYVVAVWAMSGKPA
jgi:hypothetical protein